VQRDGIPADRALADAELAGSRRAVDNEPGLEQLEEGEQSGGGAGDTSNSITIEDRK
jgi:hypothetical protein